jgi:UDP-N-acetylglucosamine 2-epimerase (non-hydrolysing)
MIDTLEACRNKASLIEIKDIINRNLPPNYKSAVIVPKNDKYALMTLHRPSNVDQREVLESIIRFFLDEVTKDHTLIWPIHPRTKKQLQAFGLFEDVFTHPNVIMLEPLGYIDMLRLNMGAKIMLTDSGGLQEECTILGTPCLTLRWNTERPITLKEFGGASVLVGNNIDLIREEYKRTRSLSRSPTVPPLWDGNTAQRCLKAILDASNLNY